MIKKTFLYLTLVFCSSTFGQTFYGQIVTAKNDTIDVQIRTEEFGANINRLQYLQSRIDVVSENGVKVYYPKDLKSFRINIERKNYTFDNVNDKYFAQRVYAGKVKLYKYFLREETTALVVLTVGAPAIFKVYSIKKPNVAGTSDMFARGFSRLITKDDMLPAISDCKYAYDKIEKDEIKVKNEEELIEFIKDYELNCFSN